MSTYTSSIDNYLSMRVVTNVTSTGTKSTLVARLDAYDRNGYHTPSSATVTLKVDGQTVASSSYHDDGVTAYGAWVELTTCSKEFTREHSDASHTTSVTYSFVYGGQTYTRGPYSESFVVQARPSYPVTYDANGGSYAPSSQTKWHDEGLYLSSSTPTRQGYVFWHWNTSSINGGTSYDKGAYYSVNANLKLYAIWNPIVTYNANGGSGAPAQQTKTYGQTLRLSTSTPQRTGYRFISWNTSSSGTGTTYNPGGDYAHDSAVTLYAQWQKVADPPTISSISVVRSREDGTQDDNGTHCVVRARWSVDTTSAGMSSNQGQVTGTITPDGGASQTISFTSGTTGTGGDAYAIVPNCDTDTQYTVTVTVTNTVVGTGQSAVLSTSRSDILTRAFFTMDFAVGGRGIGIGTAAPQSGFEVGLESQFDEDVTFLGNIIHPNFELIHSVSMSEMISTVTSAPGSITSVSGYKYGRLASVYISFTLTSSLTLGQEFNVGQLKQGWRAIYSSPVCEEFGKAMGYTNSSGSIHLTALKAVSSGSTIHVSATYMLG